MRTTALVLLLAVIILFIIGFGVPDTPLKLIFGLIVIIATVELLRVRGYSVTNNELVINRIAGSIKINLKDVMETELIDRGNAGIVFRLFGAGMSGSLGAFGTFVSFKYGTMNVYINSRRNKLLLKMNNGKKFLISPDEEIRDLLMLR